MSRTKRLKEILIIIAMTLLFAGCGSVAGNADSQEELSEKQQDSSMEEDTVIESTVTENTENDVLVIYFSREGEQYTVGVIDKGNTEIVAEIIADETGADLYEVVPADDNYPTTYDELTDVAKREQNDNARPAYQDTVPDLSQYSKVFIGAPVWWGDWPMIMYTFFENEDLAEKTLIPFSTHEGSGLSGFDKKLAATCPDSEIKTGLAIRGADAQKKQDSVKKSVKDWISGLA